MIDAIPEFSPQTTIADINTFKGEIEKTIDHAKNVRPELNQIYHSAPNQELRNLMKQHIGKYLTASQETCATVLETLTGGDTERMRKATEELKAHLRTIDEVKGVKARLMAQFGLG